MLAPKVDVIIVLYKSADCVHEAIRSLRDQDCPMALHLVDNNPGDGSLEAAIAVAPDAHVLHSRGNIGFGGGCNIALAEGNAPFALLLNPDARLEPHCLDLMLLALEEDHELAAVGPLVLKIDNATIDSAGMEIVVPGWSKDRARGKDASYAPESGLVAGLSGGVLLLRREALVAIGRDPCAFWSELFLYNEDVELSLALTACGWKLKYLKNARAWHAVGASESGRRLIRAHAARNRILTAISYSHLSDILHPSFCLLWLRRLFLDIPQLWINLHQKELRIKLPGLLRKAIIRRKTMKEIRQAYKPERP